MSPAQQRHSLLFSFNKKNENMALLRSTTRAAPSRGALARGPSASPARALCCCCCSLDRKQSSSSLLRPSKPQQQIRKQIATSVDQSALPSSSSFRRFAAPSSRAGAVVARARAELKALIFDCDGASITSCLFYLEKEKRKKVFSFLLLSYHMFFLSNPRLTPTSLPPPPPPTIYIPRRHSRVRGAPPPRLQRHLRPL